MAVNVWRWPMLGASERLEFLTDVLSPTYGAPNTRKLRATPRFAPGFTGTVFNAQARKMETALRMGRAEKWYVPLTLDFTTLPQTVNSGAFMIPVDLEGRRFYEGGDAMLMDCDGNYEIISIDAISSAEDEIDIANSSGLENKWSAGSYLMPVVEGHLLSAPAVQKLSLNAFSYSVEFLAVDPFNEVASFNGDTYRSYPVLPFDCVASVQTAHDRAASVVDYDVGLFDYYDLVQMPMSSQRFSFYLQNRAAIKSFRELIYAMSGRWKALWVPSFCKDLIPVAIQSTTVIDIEYTGINEWAITANARDLQIKLEAQTVYARITNITVVGSNERITVDTALPGGLSVSDIGRISFMVFCTQSSDTNVMALIKKDYVTSTLEFSGIYNDV